MRHTASRVLNDIRKSLNDNRQGVFFHSCVFYYSIIVPVSSGVFYYSIIVPLRVDL